MKQLTEPDKRVGSTAFDRSTASTPLGGRPGKFLVDLDDDWSALVGKHGGYLCAIVVRAIESTVPGRLVRTMTTSFLRTGRVGPAWVSVRLVRRGRSVATVVADLVQDGELVLTSRCTLLESSPGVDWDARHPVDLPPPGACAPFVPDGPVKHFARVESRFDPQQMPFTGDRPRISGYLRPLEPRPLDPAWLVMASDWFPPPAFTVAEPPTGGVSIDLTTHVHRPGEMLGPHDWLVGSFEIDTSAGGIGVEHGRLTMQDGTLVAESFQTRFTVQR